MVINIMLLASVHSHVIERLWIVHLAASVVELIRVVHLAANQAVATR